MLKQLARYGFVGILNNLIGYLIYLLITALWLDPKLAVTLMYPIGALIGYFSHASYSFAYSGSNSYGFMRYIIAHLIGYGLNIALLYLLSDELGYPHQLVQALAIVIVSGFLYLLFRYFVFPNRLRPS